MCHKWLSAGRDSGMGCDRNKSCFAVDCSVVGMCTRMFMLSPTARHPRHWKSRLKDGCSYQQLLLPFCTHRSPSFLFRPPSFFVATGPQNLCTRFPCRAPATRWVQLLNENRYDSFLLCVSLSLSLLDMFQALVFNTNARWNFAQCEVMLCFSLALSRANQNSC